MNESVIRRWYIPLTLLLIIGFVPLVKEMRRVGSIQENRLTSRAPVYSIDKIRSEMKWVKDCEEKWSTQDRFAAKFSPSHPAEYWEYLNRRDMLVDALARYSLDRNNENWPEASARQDSLATTFVNAGRVRAEFDRKFGATALLNSRPKDSYFESKHANQEVPDDKRLEFALLGYVWSIPTMFLIFCVKLKTKSLMVWPEVHHVLLASMFWPLGLGLYPHNIRREEQIRKGLEFVAQLSSAMIGLFGFGVSAPLKAQVSKAKGKSSVSEKSEKRFSLNLGLELYPGTLGKNKGVITAPWYSHSFRVGKGFSLSGFGFMEAGETKSVLFTNHSLGLTHSLARGASFATEVGAYPGGKFVQLGARVNLVKVPYVGRVLEKALYVAVVGRGFRVRGPTLPQENYLYWVSKPIPIGRNLNVSTEGFMRFRTGRGTDVGQPQLIFRHKKIRHMDFLTEFWMVGSDPTFRFGIQLH